MSRMCPPCSACDMHAVAATHSFVLQAEGADCPFNDALDKGKHTKTSLFFSVEGSEDCVPKGFNFSPLPEMWVVTFDT